MPAMWAALIALVLVAGCKKDPNDEVCTHYADLEVKCREDKSDSDDLVRDTAHNFCIKGMGGKHDDIFGPGYVKMIECTRTATTCAQLTACEEK